MIRTPVLVAAVAGMLAAQAPVPPGVDALKSYLNLQDAQIQALQQLRQQEIQATQALFAELASKQQSLREQLDRGSTDAAALGKLLLDIEALRKRLVQSHETFRTQALGVLTAEQKTKLAALEEARKLQPAIRQAEALGLLAAPDPGVLPGPGMRGFGRDFQAAPALAPREGRVPARAMPMRSPRGIPPLPQ